MNVDYPRLVLAALTLVVVLGLGVAATTSTASFGLYNPAWDGSAELRTMADSADASLRIARNTTRYAQSPANETLAIVLSPETSYSDNEITQIRSFVRDGGTLLIAEDYGPHTNELLSGIGARARVDGRPLRDDRHNWRGPAYPVARNVTTHSSTRGVRSLTLNYGSTVIPNDATVLVRSSAYAYIDDNGNERLDENESIDSHPVVTVESVGDGRVLVVSDPSVFINSMLERKGNRAFTARLLETHRRVLIDYSHTTRLPPLAALVITIRDSAGFTLGLGILGATGILLFARYPGVLSRLRHRRTRDGRSAARRLGGGEDTDALAGVIARRHPDWDEARIQRVMQGIMNHREEPRDND